MTTPLTPIEERPDSAQDGGHPGPHRRSARVFRLVCVALAGLLVALLLGWGLRRDPQLIRTVLAGKLAPNFDLPTLDGNDTIRLSDLRGQVVVVNFWASWCTACREEHPNFMAAWQRYRDQGVTFVGISFEDKTSDALAYQQQLGGDWPLVTDAGGRVAQAYGVYGVPETFFIGPTGVVSFKQVGYTSFDVLTTHINRLLPAGTP